MDAPRQLFESLKAEGLSLLERWKAEGQSEDLYLDFKQAKSPMDRDTKVNLAAGVSGFANADGGVLVWGVEAVKDRNGVDAVQDLKPIVHIKRFLTDLTENVSRVVVPAVQGVESFIILDPSAGEDAGYAVTYVPKMKGLPHMAAAQGQQRYYYRAGDSFLIMEHFMLADRFGRRPQPRLELDYRWERVKAGTGLKTYLVLGIRNNGKGLATYPALRIKEQVDKDILLYPLDLRPVVIQSPDTFSYGLPERVQTITDARTGWRTFAGGVNHAIHPSTTLDIAQALGWMMPSHSDIKWEGISISYSLYCDGFSLSEATLEIPSDEVRKVAREGRLFN